LRVLNYVKHHLSNSGYAIFGDYVE